jgi:MFS family permease
MIGSGWRTTFSSLENRTYRLYWMSLLASFSAQQMHLIVRGWLVYDLTDSALALGLVSAAAGVPILLFSLYGGVIVDRVDKRKLLIVTQALTAMATLTIAVLISMGAIALWHLIIAAIANGLILSFDLPGRQAIIPQLVGQRQIMNAVALGSGATNLTRVIAPALGGVLVGVMGIDGVYYLIVTCYVASAAFLLTMPALLTPTRDSRATVRSDLIEGLRYIRRSPILPALLAMAIVPIAFGMPYMMLMPVFAVDVLNVGASGLGYLMAAAGIGALTGSFLVASLGDFKHKGALLLVTSASFGVFLILFANSNYFYIALFFLLGVGMANSIYMTTNNTLLQINTEDRMRGRVMSLYMMTIGLLPVAVLPASAIAESLGGSIAVGVGGAILLIFTLAMTLLRPTLRRL